MFQTLVHNPAVHHEETDVDIGAIFMIGAGLIITAVAILGFVWLLFQYFNGRETTSLKTQYPLAVGQEQRLPPSPRLQITPRQDLQDLRTREDHILNSYEWVDRSAGTVRIPIAEAMKQTVQRGFPVREPPAQGKP